MEKVIEIWKIYNPPWSEIEILIFAVVFLLIAGIAARMRMQKKIRTSQLISICLLVLYLGIVFASTVFTRIPAEQPRYELQVFWSWIRVLRDQNMGMLLEIFLNFLLLFPAGFLFPMLRGRWLRIRYGLLWSALISLIIEVCQLVFHRGLFEWDDMIHNALGCMIGCGIANVIRWGIGRKNTRRGR